MSRALTLLQAILAILLTPFSIGKGLAAFRTEFRFPHELRPATRTASHQGFPTFRTELRGTGKLRAAAFAARLPRLARGARVPAANRTVAVSNIDHGAAALALLFLDRGGGNRSGSGSLPHSAI